MQTQYSCSICSVLSSVFSFILIGCSLFTVFNRGPIPNQKLSWPAFFSEDSLPLSFTVDASYDVPSRQTEDSWFSAMTDFLESSYRHYGIAHKLLNSDKFVRFSPVAFQRLVEEYVDDEIPNAGASLPALIDKYPELKKSAVPEKMCRNANCTDVFKFDNTVSFKLKNVKYAHTVSDMKHLLHMDGKPLLMTMPNPITEYWIPCYDGRVEDSKSCQAKQPCPSWIAGSSCGHMTVESQLSSSEFYEPKLPASSIAGSPITMMIVGYTDDYVTHLGRVQERIVKKSMGGFIVRKAHGNAIGLYDGSLAFLDNLVMCARDDDPRRWRGPLFACMEKQHKASSCLSVKKGPRKQQKTTSILQCINSSLCDPSKLYAIAQSPNNNTEHIVYEDQTGNTFTKMYEMDSDTDNAVLFEYGGMPYHALGKAFKRISHDKDDEQLLRLDLCNYWFLPYDVVDGMIKVSGVPLNKVHAVSMELEWSKKSYGGAFVLQSTANSENRVTTV